MITEHPLQVLDQYRNHFPGAQPALVIASILDGNTAAQLWTIPQPDADEFALLWDKGNNIFYLGGTLALETEIVLRELIQDEIRPQSLLEGAPFFKVRPFSASSVAALLAAARCIVERSINSKKERRHLATLFCIIKFVGQVGKRFSTQSPITSP